MSTQPQPQDLEALSAAWAKVRATRDASPADCPCREVTTPLIDAWFGRITITLPPADVERAWADLHKAQAAQTAAQLLPAEPHDLILDVRSVEEFTANPRPGAVNIPIHAPKERPETPTLRDRLGELPKDRRIVIFCKSGMRAEEAAHVLAGRGFHACNGHAESCPVPLGALNTPGGPSKQTTAELRAELPALQGMLHRLNDAAAKDAAPAPKPVAFSVAQETPEARLGAADDGGLLGGLFNDAAKAAAAGAGEVAKAATAGAAEAAKGAVPGVADAVRAEVPATVATAAEAAKGAVPGVVQAAGEAAKPVADAAGEAAGRGAARGAKSEGWDTGAKVVAGVVGVGVLTGIAYAVFGGKEDK